MRIAGQWVGLGLGDASEEIRRIKGFMRRKFSYASQLADTQSYDEQMVGVVANMQSRYAAQGKIGDHIPGVINVETKYAMGLLARPVKNRPVIYTVEGHMSNMWIGPCAETARILEQQGVAKWQPVGYDTVSLPFNNASGINELRRLLADRNLSARNPWGLACFSQGAIVGSEVWINEISNPAGSLHWRLKDWRATLAFGSPYRERDVVAEWIPDPPRPGTEGISPWRMTNTPRAHWKEVARRGDLYTEVDADSPATEYKRAVYLAVMNRWNNHPDSAIAQFMEFTQAQAQEILPIIQAITNGVMFLGNMAPHGGYDLAPCIGFMRNRLEQ